MRALEANLDGQLHVTGACCMDRVCRRCGAREHWQPVHGGIAELCEECVEDAVEWKARGTYLTDVMDESGHGVVGSTLVLA